MPFFQLSYNVHSFENLTNVLEKLQRGRCYGSGLKLRRHISFEIREQVKIIIKNKVNYFLQYKIFYIHLNK